MSVRERQEWIFRDGRRIEFRGGSRERLVSASGGAERHRALNPVYLDELRRQLSEIEAVNRRRG